MDSAAPKHVAREAQASVPFRALARMGYFAGGLVHAWIGTLALIVAAGGGAATDQTGAMRGIAGVPLGFALLWAIAIGFFALAAWKIGDGILIRDGAARHDPRTAQRWMRRIGQWGQAAVFAAFGGIAVATALGARLSTEHTVEAASRGVLQIPGGVFLLVGVGGGLAVTGFSFVVMGIRRSYRNQVSVPDGILGRLVDALGVVGFVAKGIALLVMGALVTVAGLRGEAKTAGGLDGALAALLDLAFGPVLVATVGVGFWAYGVFCLFRARYARL